MWLLSCFTGKICPVKNIERQLTRETSGTKAVAVLGILRFHTGVQNLCLMTWKGKVVLRDIIALAVHGMWTI